MQRLDFEVIKNMKMLRFEEDWCKLSEICVCTENLVQNTFGKIEKIITIGQDQKFLMSSLE